MGLSIQQQREKEQNKYVACYEHSHYRMGEDRFKDAVTNLKTIAKNFNAHAGNGSNRLRSLVDVGCGRSEIVRAAVSIGFWPVRGVECIDGLCGGIIDKGEITSLPYKDSQFDVVTCLDVMEHLPPDDTKRALKELWRVSRKVILVSISNEESKLEGVGVLHVNRRSYDEWDSLLREIWSPADVDKVSRTRRSETWLAVKS